MKIIRLLICYFTIIQWLPLNAQSKELVSIHNAIDAFSKQHLQEKIYLHTDKSVYLNKEICWFKIYNVDGFFHTPISLSKVVYIELIDNNNEPVLQEKISLQKVSSNGSIKLPDNIPTGKYTLVAYTNWMKNYDPTYFYTKQITVINSTYNSLANINTSTKPKYTYHIDFFPESGNLLLEQPTVIGITTKDQNGNGISAKGFIINQSGDTLQSIQTNKNGIGNFIHTSKIAQTYKAIIKLSDTNLIEALPSPSDNAFGLQVRQNKASLNAKKGIIVHAIFPNTLTNTTAYLIIHCRGVVKKAFDINKQNQQSGIEIPYNDLGEGINTITLFNAEKKPVAERLYFKYPTTSNEIIELESAFYKSRQKVNLNIKFESDPNVNLINTPFDASISVYKIDSLQSVDDISILNYLMLSTDLQGKIQNPLSYFDDKNPSKEDDIDNLLLTQGWRKFSNLQFADTSSNVKAYLPELNGLVIKGQIIDKSTGLTAKETAAYLSVPSKNTLFRSATSDKNGKISFQFDQLVNEGQVIAQVGDNLNKNYKVEIENPFIGKSIPTKNNTSLSLNDLPAYTLEAMHKSRQLQEFYIPQWKENFLPKIADTNAFYFTPDRTYFLDDYSRFATLEEVIREYINPVTLIKEEGKYQLYVYDEAYKKFFDQKPLILLDGVIIKDIDKFFEYDPLKIRKIEIISRLYHFGNISYNGILNFTTYSGKLENYELEPNSIVLDYKGLQSQRIFNAPVYETDSQIESRLPDFRHLLYWNPNAKIESNTKLSFYTSDVKGNFILSIQGINKNGKILDKLIPFVVK